MRPLKTAAVLGTALALALTAASSAAAGARVTASEQALLAEVNRVRAAHGLGALRSDRRLARAARSHTQDMLRRDRFAHGDVASRLRRFGIRTGRVGENLAWAAGSDANARAIVRMWLASPRHRANLLRRGYRAIGLAAVTGQFAGYDGALVVTADFRGL